MGIVIYAVGTFAGVLLATVVRTESRQSRVDRAAWDRWLGAPDPVSRKAAARQLTITAVARYAKTDEICGQLRDDLTRFG
jgi:hypothetical protein